MDAMTSTCNHLVLSFIKCVSMKMHRWLTVSDDASVFTSVGNKCPSLWVGKALRALVANSRWCDQMTVYIHYARGRDSLSVISLRHMRQPSLQDPAHPIA